MPTSKSHEQAVKLLRQGYDMHVRGDHEQAAALYKASIAAYPLAEAHTYLGWSYSSMGDFEGAIAECKEAIFLDPDFGNPYNDIGAYLIEMGRHDEALPWLIQAIEAPRYEPRHYPHFNLGRAHEALGDAQAAMGSYCAALEIAPDFRPAYIARVALMAMMN